MNIRLFARGLSPEARISLYYLTVFAIPGAAGAYLGIWLADQGLSSSEIGWMNAVPVLLLLALNLTVGRLADRAKDWRSAIIVGSVSSGVLMVGLFFSHGFWPILVVWTIANLPAGLMTPVIDAAAVRLTRRRGSDFGVVRAWGTIGYMLVLAGTSLAVGALGGWIFVPLIVGVAALRAVMSLVLPRFRASEDGLPEVTPQLSARSLRQLMKAWFLFPLVAFALVQSTHFILQSFAALAWRDAGIDAAWIGPLLAIGALSEAAVMLAFRRVSERYTARSLILASAAVSTVRWFIMALNPPLWGLAILQLSHGITFACGYLGVVNFIANWTADDVAAEAQSFAAVLQMAMVVVALGSFGYMFGAWGATSFLLASAVSAVALVLVVASLGMVTPRSADE